MAEFSSSDIEDSPNTSLLLVNYHSDINKTAKTVLGPSLVAPISKCTYKKGRQQYKEEAFQDGDFTGKTRHCLSGKTAGDCPCSCPQKDKHLSCGKIQMDI